MTKGFVLKRSHEELTQELLKWQRLYEEQRQEKQKLVSSYVMVTEERNKYRKEVKFAKQTGALVRTESTRLMMEILDHLTDLFMVADHRIGKPNEDTQGYFHDLVNIPPDLLSKIQRKANRVKEIVNDHGFTTKKRKTKKKAKKSRRSKNA